MKTVLAEVPKLLSDSVKTRSAADAKQKTGGHPVRTSDVFAQLFAAVTAEAPAAENSRQSADELQEALKILEELPADELTPQQREVVAGAVQALLQQLGQLEQQPPRGTVGVLPKEQNSQRLLALLETTVRQLQEASAKAIEGIKESNTPMVSETEENIGPVAAKGQSEAIFKQLTDLLQRLSAEQQLASAPRQFRQMQRVQEMVPLTLKAETPTQQSAITSIPVTDPAVPNLPEQQPEAIRTAENKQPEARQAIESKPSPVAGSSVETDQSLETVRSPEVNQSTAESRGETVKAEPNLQRPLPPATPQPVVRASQLTADLAPVLHESIRLTGNGESTQIKVSIFPEHLGHLDIRLNAADGKIIAQIFTSSFAAKEMLDFQLNQLRTSLTQQGITVDTLNVSYQQPQGFAGQHNSQPEQRPFRQQKPSAARGYEQVEEESGKRTGSSAGVMAVDYSV
ncbi:flagellar hook-length control protein FliK [Planococcus lenghuensis]|uniref:Flagellar hook-length control protein-like C-terminal domain-containing protein n=1 Tax=Planococcus lenghuensis TaxID=2213202 RepID=A0A1Q2L100_9BACL|nr:flagellar hook-length control protein FliK [Planococcus lenghuensis]AQQ54128.1 hypothetical protein B0X71_14125 [Planococcus lenghuensis]